MRQAIVRAVHADSGGQAGRASLLPLDRGHHQEPQDALRRRPDHRQTCTQRWALLPMVCILATALLDLRNGQIKMKHSKSVCVGYPYDLYKLQQIHKYS